MRRHWVLLAAGVAIVAAATGIWIGAWAAGGFPLGASAGADQPPTPGG